MQGLTGSVAAEAGSQGPICKTREWKADCPVGQIRPATVRSHDVARALPPSFGWFLHAALCTFTMFMPVQSPHGLQSHAE